MTVSKGSVGRVEWYTRSAPIVGAYNGYFTVPHDHPLANEDYYEVLEIAMGDSEFFSTLEGGAGELTYGCRNKDGSVTLGFDTLHAWDTWQEQAELNIFGGTAPWAMTYWTREKVAYMATLWAQWADQYEEDK